MVVLFPHSSEFMQLTNQFDLRSIVETRSLKADISPFSSFLRFEVSEIIIKILS